MKSKIKSEKELIAYLKKEKSNTEERLKSLKEQDPFSDPSRLVDNAASDADASEESSHDRVEAIENELNKYLEEVEKALERLTKGKYGKCVSCGKSISNKRLDVKPTALYCIECVEKRE